MEQRILSRLKTNVALLGLETERALAGLGELYGETVRYENPIQRVDGRDAFLRLMEHMVTKWAPFSMEIDEGLESQDRVWGRFFLSFRPNVFGRTLKIEGLTRCVVEGGRIVEQRDYYDAVSSVLDLVPLAGPAYRKIISKFSIE
jgi:ketosteroid isomerase-like protein